MRLPLAGLDVYALTLRWQAKQMDDSELVTSRMLEQVEGRVAG